MPILTIDIIDPANKLSPSECLTRLGPTIMVRVGWPLIPQGTQPGAPADQVVPALVDTGASDSCVDIDFAKQLDLKIIDKCSVGGVKGKNVHDVYMGRLVVDVLNRTYVGRLIGVELGSHTPIILGRDFLEQTIMIYDGLTGRLSISC